MSKSSKANVGEFLREQRRAAQLSLRQLADKTGVSNPYLSQIERGLRKPSAEVLQQIAKALRLSSEVLYIRAGLLDEPAGDRRVEEAIQTDAALTEQQKRALLEIYLSFRFANGNGVADASPSEEDSVAVAAAAMGQVPAGDDAQIETTTHER
ncbi:helix-turn-helix transcriptional regulator [Phytoactinopolyspora alkaliphila]|uniref:Helix-turn-helix transcriptional regulator n=1 Tax=Phytoactinopolyspora alkaliphila TaxID=1783498 RepID=A0A6N9YJ47_9ACTN|nr:helix-turn-helix transcriptional regulator [Phytoactinopolyspora alkaliphila]